MIKPAKQGDHDSLCGYYAFQNVMQLMNPKVVLDTSDFGHWIKIVDAAGHPVGIQDGLSRVGMLDLAKGAQAKGPVKDRFAFETPWWGATPTLDAFWSRVRRHVEEGGHAIIGFFPDSWPAGHWSVVGEASDATLHLHDSDGAHQVKRHLSRIGTRYATHARRPWRLEPASTFLFRRVDVPKG